MATGTVCVETDACGRRVTTITIAGVDTMAVRDRARRGESSDEVMHDAIVDYDPCFAAWDDVQRARDGVAPWFGGLATCEIGSPVDWTAEDDYACEGPATLRCAS